MSMLQNQQHSVHMYPDLLSHRWLCSTNVELYFLVSVFKTFENNLHKKNGITCVRFKASILRHQPFSCQKQCYYKALLSLCQIKKNLWFLFAWVVFHSLIRAFILPWNLCDTQMSLLIWRMVVGVQALVCRRHKSSGIRTPEAGLGWYCWTLVKLWC